MYITLRGARSIRVSTDQQDACKLLYTAEKHYKYDAGIFNK